MLDGGLTAWRAESGPLEQGPSALEPTDFAATERPGFFVDQSEVLAIVEGRARGRLVCVLRPEVFAGTEQRYSRPGHIPLSVNRPYVELGLKAETSCFGLTFLPESPMAASAPTRSSPPMRPGARRARDARRKSRIWPPRKPSCCLACATRRAPYLRLRRRARR